MSKYDLSILIPARNEMFVSNTVADILKNRRGKTEIIVGLDGKWAEPGITSHPDVRIVYVSESLGQRAMTNLLCRLSQARYVAKCDAHVAFSEGFDTELMNAIQGHDDWTIVPTMKNLHAFDWVCDKGHRRYQGPSGPCIECGGETKRDVIWYAKPSPNSNSYCFDKTLHFQYFKEFNKRPEGKGDLTPTMGLQGSFFMLTREKYWSLNICDEAYGSWGQQGVEVACKTWLSGGQVMVDQKCWYAHMFRTQGGDFGFPYPISGNQVDHARRYSRDIWLNNKWPLAKHDLNWLINKFAPVPYWHDSTTENAGDSEPSDTPKKGIIYYTDNQLNIKLAKTVQAQIKSIGLPIVSASLKPMNNMGKNIYLRMKRGSFTMFKQILAALEASTAEIVFFCEHDVLYHPSHFEFTPTQKDKFYYNQNFWKVWPDGFAAHWDANQVSGLCGYREHLLTYYRQRIAEIESRGFNSSYEPGSRDKSKYEVWNSAYPNIDIRHDNNLTKSHRSPNDFRDKSTCVNWQESNIDNLPGWSHLTERLN